MLMLSIFATRTTSSRIFTTRTTSSRIFTGTKHGLTVQVRTHTHGTRLLALCPVDISAQGMDLTDDLRTRVTAKIGKVHPLIT